MKIALLFSCARVDPPLPIGVRLIDALPDALQVPRVATPLPILSLEVLEAQLPDPRAPRGPVLTRLVKRLAPSTPTGASWRNALVAPGGGRYRPGWCPSASG
jgi:hypothetical protein